MPVDVSSGFVEVGVLFANMEFDVLRALGAKFTAKVFVSCTDEELVRLVGVIPHPVVQVVIDDRGSRTERYLAVEIREQVKISVVVVFNDRQLAVQDHPMQEVRELAQPSPIPESGRP